MVDVFSFSFSLIRNCILLHCQVNLQSDSFKDSTVEDNRHMYAFPLESFQKVACNLSVLPGGYYVNMSDWKTVMQESKVPLWGRP